MKMRSSLLKVICTLVVLVIVLVPAASVSAALRICRTDPLVYFEDGHKLSVTASISAPASEVTQITYVIHAPVGSQVDQVVHTAGGLGLEEVVYVYDDQPAGIYTVDTVVSTLSEGVDVQATTMLMVGVSSTATGHSFDHLITTVTDPR